jgi:hypothetical protein
MKKTSRILVLAALVVGSISLAEVSRAGAGGVIVPESGNEQEGDNSSEVNQSGSSSSGDAVGGQVVGVVSAGDASVDSTNRSEDVDIETGDAQATNGVDSFTGQDSVIDEIGAGSNEQEGDNSTDVNQTATATSGDGVGGSVIGVVTSAGGSADVVAANTSEDVDIETGDSFADNFLFRAFTGQSYLNLCGLICQIGSNEQEGDNDLAADQSATASSGDGVGGQVLGIVSAGDASVDATNSSTDVDVETGGADADNEASPFTGQDYFNLGLQEQEGENELDGDNSTDLNQAASATSGDGVGGQVAGVVTSAGGSADVVAANTSDDVDVETGDSSATNFSDTFVGQSYVNLGGLLGGDYNYQTGDNELEADQTAAAASGDGVGGQVLGVVSAGDASVDATNATTDSDVETGDADADNFATPFVGQLYFNGGLLNGGGENDMVGDISYELAQDASAASGDAVAGQVAGVVTSAGGSADLVLANTSEDVDAESGEAEFDNEDESFVGQEISAGGLLFIGL